MTRKHKKKTKKQRGKRTFGYGRVGQHRKTGQRAGRGKTTQWKKSKKSYYLKQKELGFPDPDWKVGKHGFKRPQDMVRLSKVNTINVKDLDLTLEKLVQQEKATKSGNTYTINLDEMNIQKVLGKGEINKKVNITVKNASKGAIEKIEQAGGQVNFLFPEDHQ
ncbi:MAG: 50S ribosomal protein L15 [Candidatus Lokiarchaeota archaeon]|jgi:large subunit ribosomal protein L15|nr:50S ribosomal protein L15 [Candidatus Lokiarchaeota archaeon]